MLSWQPPGSYVGCDERGASSGNERLLRQNQRIGALSPLRSSCLDTLANDYGIEQNVYYPLRSRRRWSWCKAIAWLRLLGRFGLLKTNIGSLEFIYLLAWRIIAYHPTCNLYRSDQRVGPKWPKAVGTFCLSWSMKYKWTKSAPQTISLYFVSTGQLLVQGTLSTNIHVRRRALFSNTCFPSAGPPHLHNNSMTVLGLPRFALCDH